MLPHEVEQRASWADFGELPFLTADLPGVGGVIKQHAEDFVVEEIPAYEPCGTGEHLLLWVEKRDVSAERLIVHLAKSLRIPRRDIGTAGMKDRRAVTRQFVSVPAACEERAADIETDAIHVLQFARHRNKLKTGHLKGNRFSILVRQVAENAIERADTINQRIERTGFPNYFGEQRFGADGDNAELGLDLLRGDRTSRSLPGAQRPFLLRLALSAAQSLLFNRVLAERIASGLIERVEPGDVMQVVASGGLFIVEDSELEIEQLRFEAGETVPTGPIFGPKMRRPAGHPAEHEADVLRAFGLRDENFRRYARLTSGARRPLLVRPQGLAVEAETEGLRFRFDLPPGAYATVLLREYCKQAPPAIVTRAES